METEDGGLSLRTARHMQIVTRNLSNVFSGLGFILAMDSIWKFHLS